MNTLTLPAKLSVLFATSEIYPLVKTGGLADVSAALPAALRHQGVHARILVPGYPQILTALKTKWVVATGVFEFGEARLLSALLPASDVPLYIIDCPALYQREGGPYQDNHGNDWIDNAPRFALLSRFAALLGSDETPLPWRPDVIHCNDWQTGLAPAYLHYLRGKKAATVMTIHNLAYQGVFPSSLVAQLGLPMESYSMHGVEYFGHLSFLKAGLHYADRITTVSPTYAEEIQEETLGFGMQGLLAKRSEHLSGILNGIDEEHWNPASDRHLSSRFDAGHLDGKTECKRALQQRLDLETSDKLPILAVISRLTHQKGLDLVLEAATDLIKLPAQLAILGSGDSALELAFRLLAQDHPGKVSVTIGYDEGLAHQIEAGADIFLMPSRFEPCGLNQMYSMRYGTPPVVFATGGLADTVVDFTDRTLADSSATGFVFDKLKSSSLTECVKKAAAAYSNKKTWRRLQQNGMNRDFSWDHSAKEYIALYRQLVPE